MNRFPGFSGQKRGVETREHIGKHGKGHDKGEFVGLEKFARRRVPSAYDGLMFSLAEKFKRPGDQAGAGRAPGRRHHMGIIGHKRGKLVQSADGFGPGEKGDYGGLLIFRELVDGFDHAISGGRRGGSISSKICRRASGDSQ